jgi:integrase
MSSEGSITKRCNCKDPADTKKRLGSSCPKLRRPGGAWSTTHGTWGFQIELPTAGTKRRPLRRGGFDGREQARDELDRVRSLLDLAGDDPAVAVQIGDLLHACKAGTPLPDRDEVAARVRAGVPASSDLTTGQYLQQWLDGRRGLSPKTLRGYSDDIRLYLIPHLGEIPLQQLRINHVQAMFHALEKRNDEIRAGRASTDPVVRARFRNIRPRGDSSMRRLFATLRVALNHAVTPGRLIPINPAIGIELNPEERPLAKVWTEKAIARWKATGQRPSPVMVWRPQEAGAFLDYVQTHDAVLYPMFALILHRGLRRGECCGLSHYDVDLDDKTLTVIDQVTPVGYTPVKKKVKSRAGERTMPLGPTTTVILTDYELMRDGWRQASGDDWPNTDYYFVRPDGQPWHPQRISDRFDALIAASGLPPIRLHDLRHCAATYLRHGGADMKEVQTVLGHSKVGLTSDTYTAVVIELQRDHADAAADLIPRKKADLVASKEKAA